MFRNFAFVLIFCVFICSICACSGNSSKNKRVELKTRLDSVAYFLGAYNLGKPMLKDSVIINPDVLAQGVRDAFNGDTLLINEDEGRKLMMSFQQDMMAKHQQKMKEQGEKNKIEGQAFLDGNKKKPGIIILPSGLQYQVIKEGTGKQAKIGDTVQVNYKGTTIQGKVFDSSYDRKQPATFALQEGLVKGWIEGIPLMKEGAKYKFFIPSDLGYGEQGPPDVGPNAVMVFEVELLNVIEPTGKSTEQKDKPQIHKMEIK